MLNSSSSGSWARASSVHYFDDLDARARALTHADDSRGSRLASKSVVSRPSSRAHSERDRVCVCVCVDRAQCCLRASVRFVCVRACVCKHIRVSSFSSQQLLRVAPPVAACLRHCYIYNVVHSFRLDSFGCSLSHRAIL